jgi:hypothetical protein
MLRGALAHFLSALSFPVPSPKDPGLRNVFPLSWDPFVSYSISPTQIAELSATT